MIVCGVCSLLSLSALTMSSTAIVCYCVFGCNDAITPCCGDTPVSHCRIAPSEKALPADDLLAKIRPARRPPGRDEFLPVNCRPGEPFMGAAIL